MRRYARPDDFPGIEHDQALALACAYAREHSKPFLVVGMVHLGFGACAEEDLSAIRAACDDFAAKTGHAPLVTTYRVRPDGQLEAA